MRSTPAGALAGLVDHFWVAEAPPTLSYSGVQFPEGGVAVLFSSGSIAPPGSWNSMVTHRVRFESAKQVNAELIGWLKEAYDHA